MPDRRVVLLIEDDDDLRRLYRQTLQLDGGYAVHEARDGFEALQKLETLTPDVIVLDLALPGVTGRSVRDELAANPRTRSIPIVVVTGASATAEELDVPCLLHKPVSGNQLLLAIAACLKAAGL